MESFDGDAQRDILATRISELVSLGNKEEALTLLQEDKYRKIVEGNCWELIPVLTKHLSETTAATSPQLFDCSCTLLQEIAERSNPKEALIGFLEEAEDKENHVKFLALLDPLRRVLLRFPSRRAQSLELCLEVIESHLDSLALPKNHVLEGEERLLLDADPCVEKIAETYSELITFYEPFATDFSVDYCKFLDVANRSERIVLITHLLRILGKPLAYLDMDCDDTAKSASRNIAEKLLAYLNLLVSDLFIFLAAVEEKETTINEDSCADVTHGSHSCIVDCNVNTLSFAMLYYLLLGEGVNLDSVPLVYDVLYVFQRVLYLAAFLLRQPSHLLVHKGLRLTSVVLVRLPRGEVPSELLDSPNHKSFAEALCNVLIYSEQKENRLSALKILKMYLFIFDHKGRYLLMCNLPEVCNHDGAMELLVVTFKDMIYEAHNGGGAPCSKYFMGGHLRSLLLSLSALTHGVETDLVETAKQILGSLNLVRFLILYDKEGLLGVREALPELEQRLLEPLKQGITLSRAHYELKLKELKEEYVQNVKLKDSRVCLTVGGKPLPNLPMESKVSVVKSALQCFDLMEFSLGQVHDCMRELGLKK